MKKCASCTKDLPEAALHCVFCGAKQPPAPAVQPGLAKTAFGYSNEQLQQLKSQQPAPGPYVPPAPPAAIEPPRAHSPSQQPAYANHAQANAATLFVNNPPPQMAPPAPPAQQAPNNAFASTLAAPPPYNPQPVPAPQYPAPVPQPMAPPNPGMGVQGPSYGYNGPIPAAGSPAYQAKPGNPVDPWKSSLPLQMIIWGIATLVAFVTPMHLDPLGFNWDLIIHGPMEAKVPMLSIAAMGLLGVVIAVIPMQSLPRGILAALLGLATFVVPMVVAGKFPTDWHVLAPLIGALLIVPSLLVRNEYTEAALPRVLVTTGVVLVLLPFVVPDNGAIPLVGLMKSLVAGHIHTSEIVAIATVVFVILNLLVWMPGPATAGGKVFAWVWMLSPLIIFVGMFADHPSLIGEMAKSSPGMLLQWVFVTTSIVFIGYGLATVVGKQLE